MNALIRNKLRFSQMITLFCVAIFSALVLGGCSVDDEDDEPNFTTGTVTTLTADVYADGAITSSNWEQWFKFTATASIQYIGVIYGTLPSMYCQIYDINGNTVGDRINFDTVNPPYTGRFTSRNVTNGRAYYIKVTPYTNSSSGTYRIKFSASELSPEQRQNAIILSADTWTDGAISGSGQTYKFTATANTQYIHINFGTLTDLYIRLYNSAGIMLGTDSDDKHLSGTSNTSTSFSHMVTNGQVYYLRVFSSETYSGTYRLTFNNIPLPPGTLETANPLTIGTWADGELVSTNDQDWYKFTAITGMHYIHINFGSLTNLYVRLYDNTGNTLGDWINLYSNTTYTSLMVSSGQSYYLRVQTPSSGGYSGTYQIALNTSNIAP